MSRIIEHPDSDTIKKFGPLGWVSDVERQRIFTLPYGQFKPEITRLEKEIKEFKKKQKTRRF